MRSMLILEEMLEMFATTVQAGLNATLHVYESGLQDVLTNRCKVANISTISSSLDMLLMMQGM